MTNPDVGNGLSDQEIQHFPSMEETKARRSYRKALICALGVSMVSVVAITALAHSNSLLSIPLFDAQHAPSGQPTVRLQGDEGADSASHTADPIASAPAGTVRPDVSSWVDQTYQGDLRTYARAIASLLDSMLGSSADGRGTASAWEALHKQVACANQDFGVSGVVLYAEVRDRVINTEERRRLFAEAAEAIAGGEGGHRHERYKNALESCVKH